MGCESRHSEFAPLPQFYMNFKSWVYMNHMERNTRYLINLYNLHICMPHRNRRVSECMCLYAKQVVKEYAYRQIKGVCHSDNSLSISHKQGLHFLPESTHQISEMILIIPILVTSPYCWDQRED